MVALEEQSVYREADKVCDHRNRPNDDGRECQTTPGVLLYPSQQNRSCAKHDR